MKKKWFPLLLIILFIFILILIKSNDRSLQSSISRKELPHHNLHIKWMKQNVSREGRNHKEIRLISAYKHPDYIAVTMTSTNLLKSEIFCHYYDKNRLKIGTSVKSNVFPESTIYCPVRYENVKYMGLTKAQNEIPRATVPITDRGDKEYEHFLSVCVAPIYGKEPKWLQIVEFVEHYKLMGFTWFYFYVSTIDDYSRSILEDYERRGEIELVRLYDGYNRNEKYWHMVEIHDCLQRSRQHSKWTAFVDLDERLMSNNTNFTDYLRKLEDNIASISFRQQWIMKTEFLPPKYINETHLVEWMPTQRFTNSSAFGSPGHTAKCIVQPEKIGAMFIHYPFAIYPPYKSKSVDIDVGYVRHYRDLNLGDWGKNWLNGILKFGELRETHYSEKLNAELVKNTIERVKYVYEVYK